MSTIMPPGEQEQYNQGSAVVATGIEGVKQPSFDFTLLPQLIRERVANYLAFPAWFAFMQASKESLAYAFNQEMACQRIISVLMDLTVLDGISLELLLVFFRASPIYQTLMQKMQNTPETVSAAEWIACIHSQTSVDQISALSKIASFYSTLKKVIDSRTDESKFKQFVVSTQLYMLSNRDFATSNFTDYFSHNLHLTRLTQLTQPLPEFDQLDKIISTLEKLPHDEQIEELIESTKLIFSMGLEFMNGLLAHDAPLPRLMLMGLSMPSINLSQLDFCFANLQYANFSTGFLCEMLCRHANFRNANLSEGYLVNADFYAADLRKANLQQVFFMLGNLSHANLGSACLQRAYLVAANLSKAIIIDANLNYADLSLANLTGTNFSLSEMDNVQIIQADMRDANLRGVKMRCAVLIDVNMMQVDLTGANLTDTSLTNVDLSGAILVDVNLQNVKMKKVKLINAKVLGVKCDHLLDIDLLRARLDIVHQYMQGGIIHMNCHRQFRNCATQELVACAEAHEDIPPQVRIRSLEAVIQHPIFTNTKLHKIEKGLNYSIGLFAPNQIAIRSENQQMIADCLLRLQADLVIRPEC